MADNAGLDFHYNPPKALKNGHIFETEGTASICDSGGNLLFYAQPRTAWNKANAILNNGSDLKGGNSSTQGAMILPFPGNDTLYYLFTLDEYQNNLANGLCYSVVNMCDLLGMGSIISTKKNIFLTGSLSEKMAATNHANGNDFWLVVHKFNSNAFYSYKITKNGIESPVISSVGHRHPLSGNNVASSLGQMKISADGSKLALVFANATPNLVELFDFDNSTGKVSHAIQLPGHIADYGVSFSPNSKLLYVSSVMSPQGGAQGVFQYDATQTDSQSVVASVYKVSDDHVHGMQLGPDGKIYCVVKGQSEAGVIQNPDEQGSDCQYKSSAVDIGGPAYYSLPGFIDSYRYPATSPQCNCKFLAKYFCEGDSTLFYLPNPAGVDSVSWDFGDTATGTRNYSKDISPKHVFSDTGAFTVSLKYYKNGTAFSGSRKVVINPVPVIDFPADTIVSYCDEIIYLKPKTSGNVFYRWEGGILPSQADDSVLEISSIVHDGMIRLIVVNASGCWDVDSVYYEDKTFPKIKEFLPKDTAVCTFKSLWLKPNIKTIYYKWQDGSTDKDYYVSKPGKYWVQAYNTQYCRVTDTFEIKLLLPEVHLGNDTALCPGAVYRLKVDSGYANYLWQDGSKDSFFMVKKAGTYWVKVSNSLGCTTTDTVEVKYDSVLKFTHSKDTVICNGNPVKLWVKVTNGKVSWPGGGSDTLTVNKAMTVKIKAFNRCTTVVDSIVVKQSSVYADLGPDTSFCKGVTYVLKPDDGKSTSYLWQDGSKQPTYTVTQTGTYWVKITNGICSVVDTVHVTYIGPPVIHRSSDTTICEGEVLKTWIKVDNGTVSWPGGSSDTFAVSKKRIIKIKATNHCGSVTDSIVVNTKPKPKFDLGADTSLCEGQTLTLKGPAGAYWCRWQNGSQYWTFEVNKPGTYWVEAETPCKTITDTIHISYDKPLSIDLGNDTLLCAGETLELDAGPARSYQWQDGSQNRTYHVSRKGIYKVTALNACNMGSDYIRVDYDSIPYIDLGPDIMLCDTQSLRLNANLKRTSVVWQDGSTQPYFVVREPGLYYVSLTNHCGSYRDSIQVGYEDCYCEVFIPNAFTPNADSVNESYKPIGCRLSSFHMIIYNRWGERVFESFDMDQGWNGKFKDAPCEEGMYIYTLSGKDKYKKYIFRKGSFYLLK